MHDMRFFFLQTPCYNKRWECGTDLTVPRSKACDNATQRTTRVTRKGGGFRDRTRDTGGHTNYYDNYNSSKGARAGSGSYPRSNKFSRRAP